MTHGIVMGSGALLGLAAALACMYALRADGQQVVNTPSQARVFFLLVAGTALLLWLSVIIGTYVIFPPYRIAPPEGTLDLSAFPRALILADAQNAWLHRVAMEIKEHVPWIAAMLTTAVAFVSARYGEKLLNDPELRRMTGTLLGISFVLVTIIALLGTLINKFAPLQ
jgi:hypothetical protein